MKKAIYISAALLTIFVIAIIAIVVAVQVTTTRSAFLRQTEEEIRTYMLELTPIGMSMDDARGVLEYRFQVEEWSYGPWGIDYRKGVWPRFDSRIHAYRPLPIVVKSINLQLGSYRRQGRLLGFTHVYASLGFDENDNLIDVHISKSRPAL